MFRRPSVSSSDLVSVWFWHSHHQKRSAAEGNELGLLRMNLILVIVVLVLLFGGGGFYFGGSRGGGISLGAVLLILLVLYLLGVFRP